MLHLGLFGLVKVIVCMGSPITSTFSKSIGEKNEILSSDSFQYTFIALQLLINPGLMLLTRNRAILIAARRIKAPTEPVTGTANCDHSVQACNNQK
jgi:hypothetical protein